MTIIQIYYFSKLTYSSAFSSVLFLQYLLFFYRIFGKVLTCLTKRKRCVKTSTVQNIVYSWKFASLRTVFTNHYLVVLNTWIEELYKTVFDVKIGLDLNSI